MNINILIQLFDRDLSKLKQELELYHDEANIWHIEKGIANSAGNLCLHLIGNLNHFIGAVIGNTDYIRDRENEFSAKNISRIQLLDEVDQVKAMIKEVLEKFDPALFEQDYPRVIMEITMSYGLFLTHLATHLSYHLGQINYHRRLIDCP